MVDTSITPHHPAPHLSPPTKRFTPRPAAFSPGRSSNRSNRFHSTPFGGGVVDECEEPWRREGLVDKGKLYDRAFQRSNAAGSTSSRRPLVPRAQVVPPPPPPPPTMERKIDEESALDGDSYIATTREHPWGEARGEDEEGEGEGAERREGEEVGAERPTMGGMLAEMYDVSGKQW